MSYKFLELALAATCLVGACVNMNEDYDHFFPSIGGARFPSFSVGAAEVGAVDAEFERLCLEAAGGLLDRGDRIASTRLTYTAEWGLVFRLDMVGSESESDFSRVICWRGSDGHLLTAIASDGDIARL